MKKFLVIFIIIVIIIIIYLFFFIRKKDKYTNLPLHNYSDIKHKFKTGDIVVFSCKKQKNIFNDLEYYFRTNFVGSEFGHAGIVLKNNNTLYIIECTDVGHTAEKDSYFLNNFKKGGVRLVEMDKLISQYHKENGACFAVKFISKEIPNNIILSKLKKYNKIVFQEKNILYFLAIVDVAISHQLCTKLVLDMDKNKMMCTEFMHDILYKCNILKKYPSKIFWPHLIMDGTLDQLTYVKYSEPCKFVWEKTN